RRTGLLFVSELSVCLGRGWPERDARGSFLYRSFPSASAVGGLRETHGAPFVSEPSVRLGRGWPERDARGSARRCDMEPSVRAGRAGGGGRESAGRARRGGAGATSGDGTRTTA